MVPMAPTTGRRLIIASWAGTAAFAATALPAAAGLRAFEAPSLAVDLLLFVGSLPLALYALGAAAVRAARRGERITVTGLFFLSGSAPRRERTHLLGSLGATVAVAVAALALSATRGSPQPFGVLVPVYPLAMTSLWGARHGTFPPIPEPTPARRAHPAADPANAPKS
jgi:hypothetical protein